MESQAKSQMEQPSGTEEKDSRSERTERRYTIRQVTQIQPSWREGKSDEPGEFYVQLVLDNGVDEYIIQPTATDISQLLKMFERSQNTIWDDERKILIFENITTTSAKF